VVGDRAEPLRGRCVANAGVKLTTAGVTAIGVIATGVIVLGIIGPPALGFTSKSTPNLAPLSDPGDVVAGAFSAVFFAAIGLTWMVFAG